MHIFWRLILGHLLADFTFQTDHINSWKRSSPWGMLVHCLIHPVVCAALTWDYLPEVWVRLPWLALTGWACLTIIFVTHFVEDYWRVYTIRKYHAPDNTLYFLWDQVIHYAVILAVVPESFRAGGSLVPERWPVLACLFVVVTHACTVLIYFIDKDLHGNRFPEVQEKYVTMGERLVLGLCFLIPTKAFLLLVAGWVWVMYQVRLKRLADFSWLSFRLGGAVTALCGVAARIVYYS